MKTQSAKAKGRNLQKYVREKLLSQAFSGQAEGATILYPNVLEQDDVMSRSMGSQGVDVILSPKAQKFIPFDIECKNQENLNIWSALEQTMSNTKQGRMPLLVFKRNHTEVFACLKLDDLLELLKWRPQK